VQSVEADSKPLVVSQASPFSDTSPAVVSDSGTRVQLECLSDENTQAELRQLREEVRMLRVKCQRFSGRIITINDDD